MPNLLFIALHIAPVAVHATIARCRCSHYRAMLCMQAQPLLLTGHRDGRVRMWDMACEVPRLLGTAPHDMGGPGSRLQAVSIIKVRLSLLQLLRMLSLARAW